MAKTNNTYKKTKTNKKRGKGGLIVLFSFLALLILAAIVWLLFFKSSDTTQELQQRWYREAAESGILGWDVNGTSGDRDDDGIPDAEEILNTAKTYVRSRPQYESRYYPLGYPNDGYGVCTDVVDFSLLRAGFDMQALIDRDARENPEAYPRIEAPDPKIDFRRVVNLAVYFQRYGVTLTTDPLDTEAWQPGDIVVFPGHIGIVSDRRNRKGVPYVLHHAAPGQQFYEQDILESRKISGHYRVG